MNTLKMAMRSFAKATSHLFTLLPSAELPSTPSTETTTPATPPAYKSRFGPAAPPDDQTTPLLVEGDDGDSGMIDEANGIILDKLFQTITGYLQSIVGPSDQLSTPSGAAGNGKTEKLFAEDEINNFVHQLTISTQVPVTTTILQVVSPSHSHLTSLTCCQSNRYKNLTKHLRLLSKGKTKDGKTIDATVQVASSKV